MDVFTNIKKGKDAIFNSVFCRFVFIMTVKILELLSSDVRIRLGRGKLHLWAEKGHPLSHVGLRSDGHQNPLCLDAMYIRGSRPIQM